ncbi:MAG: prepilin-type N-terminal cleavage/methylation domain-containing protein [Nitrospinae bacterium]|nr:prepilin-type N-terminal cleavage/methylation domain-containing protein [Nitrospinota bacterium]
MKLRYQNQSGFSLTELLIVMAMGVILMGATIQVFIKQEKTMRDQMTKTNLRALGRIAMDEIAMEIRRAGMGFPNGEGVTAIAAGSISLRGNTEVVLTTIRNDVTGGVNQITVWDNDDFSGSDLIVIFDPSAGGQRPAETSTVNSTPSNKINMGSATTVAYDAEDGVLISQYHTTDFAYDGANNRVTKSIDSAADVPVVGKVSSLTFTYYDNAGAVLTIAAASIPSIRKIGIQLVMIDITGNSTVSVTFNTEVNLRNMGT